MFTRKTEKSALEKTIESADKYLSDPDLPQEEYLHIIEALTALHKLEPSRRPSADTVAMIAGNLLGIAMILSYERAHVITSKAISFVGKLK